MNAYEKSMPLTAAVLALTCGLTSLACTDADEIMDEAQVDGTSQGEFAPPEQPVTVADEDELEGESISPESLPFIDTLKSAETFIQRLPESTPNGENVALHVRLPPALNKDLDESLVRIVGDPKSPIILFRTDALVELGMIAASPGDGFFTTFAVFDIEQELALREEVAAKLSQAEKVSDRIILFEGRTPVAVTTGVKIDKDSFVNGDIVPLGPCKLTPTSELARWQESLAITDLAVVEDPERTNDACGGGNPDGVWTFKHLVEEMANGAGMSTEDFVVDWLSRWLDSYTVNADTLAPRTAMFNLVIKPWADVSGAIASFDPNSDPMLKIDGSLDFDKAPFRLSAIVNRIDLGETEDGVSGYGGSSTALPADAGELRFVFGVQNLDTCTVMPFSVIFEYGVPIEGCEKVRDWAIQWTELNDASIAAPFSDDWRKHLATLTESVVLEGAAPAKGNKNALNQLRTNENALDEQWQLREFTFTNEQPKLGTDAPVSGPLRPHTVAMTPNDTVYHPTPNGMIDSFVFDEVLPSVPASVPALPQDCSSSFSVPWLYLEEPFRGGDSLTASAGPTHWNASVNSLDNREACARHEFSFNTCNGCHFRDTATRFFHIDPTVKPASLSNFMTGGTAGIWSVPDPQFPGTVPNWTFSDLDFRFKRLYEIACSSCGKRIGKKEDLVELVFELSGVVPIDPAIDPELDLPIGPITDLGVVKELIELSHQLANEDAIENVELGGIVRKRETFVH
ncbi:hypothetical protein G6O69_04120 [Pseudenhygromyxa sp. WMMC2535]|uniref:hypothetical protein n=1 Tax=Pseudenhygromyxa sp. WMMC2535 TaxID=2712867 RepID=UPI001595AD47|nr:hypothetical protein [Pseudenhygromyxa sp. WMMC2535]NVB37003.1 hypothetical protein [Pseudenhygromyxa sp. WMMC2535]